MIEDRSCCEKERDTVEREKYERDTREYVRIGREREREIKEEGKRKEKKQSGR